MRARLISLAAFAGLLILPSTSHAAHHLWRFTQLFSNASGSTQFAEMFTNDQGETALGSFTIVSGGNTLSFVTNLTPVTGTRTNNWLLVATSNFQALAGGVQPDYIIPANFFPTGGGTLNYASSTDIWTFGTVPTDGVHSLMRDGTTPVNSPINFAGTGGSVNLTTAVPAVPTFAIALLVGALLLAGSGLLRRRRSSAA
jgi:MYXO-CTERM domain-containing protein